MKKTTTDRERNQLKAALWSRPYTPNGFGYAFSDVVVIRIDQFAHGKPLRTLVLPTGGTATKVQDGLRAQRMFRRLRRWTTFKATTDFPRGRECDGMFGTMFGYLA